MIRKKYQKITWTMLILISLLSMVSTGVYANQTKSYSCTIERYYRHPISGQIEDSGGEKSFDIGQGMVEGTVYNSGLIEEASSGQLFLTVTMSLADFSGNYQFWVQEGGVGPFQAVDYQVTGTGSDTNGSTKTILIPLSSSQSIVKASMFVEPMGRQVFFYLKPSGFQEIDSGANQGTFENSKQDEKALETSPLAKNESQKDKSDKVTENSGTTSKSEKPKTKTANKTADANESKGQSILKTSSKKGLQTSLDHKKERSVRKNPLCLFLFTIFPPS
ncbi:heme-binding Shp domain-containing protein [Streptococcus iniae]|uniref:heme-binding Shp domain-containing protein n=1 Tax=Streptococcus iniae TaxID=1346 RepID=UPI0034600C2D